MDFLQIGLAFIEGLALIISPCILPVLPLVLSTSIDGGRRRPFGIILGFILTFALFALGSRQLVVLFNINLDYIKYGSLALLTLLGVLFLSEKLLARFASLTERLANFGMQSSNIKRDGFLSGIMIGALIGLVWTPCAGPIMASALIQIIRAERNLNAIMLIFAFSFGAGLPMFIISLTGRKLIMKLRFISNHSALVHKTLGIMILSSIALISFGVNAADLTSWNNKATAGSDKLQGALATPYPAPEFAASDKWLNTPNNQPISIKNLKGKVVLVDFWTYSCINCIRTLPYITEWDKKYRKDGLVIVGVHAPEFEFEKNMDNVKQAISRYNIKYPVAMDNNLDTWINYNNQYWPAHYLIDKNGMVVYTHFGEGQYQETENNIRVLLGQKTIGNSTEDSGLNYNISQTPETYLGYARTEAFASPEGIIMDKANNYSLPGFLSVNNWALQGNWTIHKQQIVSGNGKSGLQLNFNARHVYLVLGSANGKPIKVSLKLNGKLVTNTAGKDVKNSSVMISNYRLYDLIDQGKVANSLLEINASESGVEAYAFTFG
jgi:cytochrome c biogenesis protein CcdA/thiol-disulfide isomerase/thioredoxin